MGDVEFINAIDQVVTRSYPQTLDGKYPNFGFNIATNVDNDYVREGYSRDASTDHLKKMRIGQDSNYYHYDKRMNSKSYLIIISPNPLTYLLFPIKEFFNFLYCQIIYNYKS